MNRCEEMHRKWKMRLWAVIASFRGCLHGSSMFHISRKVDRGIVLDLIRALDSCGGCLVGYLIGGENSDQVFTIFKDVELFLDVAVIIFTLNRS